MAPLVLAHPASGRLVGLAHALRDVARRQVVVAGERLVLLEALRPLDDRGPLAIGALVGDDLPELVLGEVGELGDGLARGQLVVVGDRGGSGAAGRAARGGAGAPRRRGGAARRRAARGRRRAARGRRRAARGRRCRGSRAARRGGGGGPGAAVLRAGLALGPRGGALGAAAGGAGGVGR